MVTRYDVQDLYTQGEDFTIPGPDGTLWELHFRKLNPVQQQRAVRAANASRVRMMQVLNRDPETDDDRLILEDSLEEIGGRQELIDFLVTAESANDRHAVEQEIAAEPDWAEEGLIQSLYDAWDIDMQAEYAKGEDNRSPESQEIFDQLKEFTNRIDARVDVIGNETAGELDELSDEDLRKKAMKLILERDAGMLWMKTYRDYQMLFGIESREDHVLLYDKIEQVIEIPVEVYSKYLDVITKLTLPATDLK